MRLVIWEAIGRKVKQKNPVASAGIFCIIPGLALAIRKALLHNALEMFGNGMEIVFAFFMFSVMLSSCSKH